MEQRVSKIEVLPIWNISPSMDCFIWLPVIPSVGQVWAATELTLIFQFHLLERLPLSDSVCVAALGFMGYTRYPETILWTLQLSYTSGTHEIVIN